MINTVALFFTEDFQLEYEPVHLLLGVGIGIIGVGCIFYLLYNKRKENVK